MTAAATAFPDPVADASDGRGHPGLETSFALQPKLPLSLE